MAARVKLAGGGRVGSHRGRGAGHGWIAPEPPKANSYHLIAAGVPADRISTISFGKERPFVLGHDKSAWKWNRRGHFVLLGK